MAKNSIQNKSFENATIIKRNVQNEIKQKNKILVIKPISLNGVYYEQGKELEEEFFFERNLKTLISEKIVKRI